MAIYAAHHGFKSYGIDFNALCIEYANRNIVTAESLGMIPRNSLRVALGNFFSSDIALEERLGGESVDAFRLENRRLSSAVQGKNPYGELGLRLGEVDVFYHYQVELRQNLLRLVAEHAKVGAWFVITTTMTDTFEIPSTIRLVKERGGMQYFQKVA